MFQKGGTLQGKVSVDPASGIDGAHVIALRQGDARVARAPRALGAMLVRSRSRRCWTSIKILKQKRDEDPTATARLEVQAPRAEKDVRIVIPELRPPPRSVVDPPAAVSRWRRSPVKQSLDASDALRKQSFTDPRGDNVP